MRPRPTAWETERAARVRRSARTTGSARNPTTIAGPSLRRPADAQSPELDCIEDQEHREDDHRDGRGRAQVLALECFAIDQLHQRDSRVVRRALGEDVELVKGE